jgi:hypothetical protein
VSPPARLQPADSPLARFLFCFSPFCLSRPAHALLKSHGFQFWQTSQEGLFVDVNDLVHQNDIVPAAPPKRLGAAEQRLRHRRLCAKFIISVACLSNRSEYCVNIRRPADPTCQGPCLPPRLAVIDVIPMVQDTEARMNSPSTPSLFASVSTLIQFPFSRLKIHGWVVSAVRKTASGGPISPAPQTSSESSRPAKCATLAENVLRTRE